MLTRKKIGLKAKFILAVVATLSISYGLLMVYSSIEQNRLVLGLAEQQARLLHKQILLTRRWVADHNGLFIIQHDDELANPYLHHPLLKATSGEVLLKRNPAMVTRELSEYAARDGFCWFRVTSLRPINPRNLPDEFERACLLEFEHGVPEVVRILVENGKRTLRYSAPLKVERPCLNCHAEQGYHVGDIRGALSVTVPIGWADRMIRHNNRSILLYGLLSICSVIVVLLLLFNTLVSGPVNRLVRAMDNFPQTSADQLDLPSQDDEIGLLADNFRRFCRRLEAYQQTLNSAQAKAFHAEKLAALGQLTAGIAHEVNNPLGGMLNCVKSMQAEPENLEMQARYLELLDKGLHRIKQTMHQLLKYGRTAPLQLNRVNVDQVIRDCIDLLEYRLRDIELIMKLQVEDSPCLDLEAIKQIVINITLNAIQAMPGGGRLTISSHRRDNWVILGFADSGPGIPEDIREKIFEPFFTTKEVDEGTGLGLAVCQSLVRQMGGRITVESEPGQGATFTVCLPLDLKCPACTDPQQGEDHGENPAG